MKNIKPFYLSFILVILLIVSIFLFMYQGEASVSPVSFIKLFLNLFTKENTLSLFEEIILNIKLPIVIAACLSGFAYGLSGSMLQSLLRNPLADPGVLGISSGASLMVVLGLWFFNIPIIASFNQNITVLILASIGGGIVLMIMYFVSKLFINGKMTGVLLAGIALSSIFSSILMLIITFSDQGNLRFALSWLMGGIQSLSWGLLLFDLILLFMTSFILLKISSALDLLSLGEIEAESAGVNLKSLLLIILIGLSFLLAISVSMAGPVAFIGLISPHIIRFFGVRKNFSLMLNSGLMGALLVLLAEDVARNMFAPLVLPLGAVTALIGAPFFLSVLYKARKLSLFS